LRLVDGGRFHRAFLHIDDANEAFQRLLDHPGATRNQVFNFGNPQNNVTIRDLATLMLELYRQLTGRVPVSAVEDISGEEFYGRGYEDGDRRPPDISKMHALGWRPRYDLRSTLRDAMVFYLNDANAAILRGYSELAGASIDLERRRIAITG
jgi:UDP-apiose/xylose synthase